MKKRKKKVSGYSFAFRNVLFLILTVTILTFAKKAGKPYTWLFDDLLAPAAKNVKELSELSYDEKMEARLGITYNYFKFINDNTPEESIILMPPNEVILKEDENKFNRFATNKGWASYFVYPRKLIYYDQSDDLKLFRDSITHIAVIHGWGYELVDRNYKKKLFDIIPLGSADLLLPTSSL